MRQQPKTQQKATRTKQTTKGRTESSLEVMVIPFFLQYSHLTGIGCWGHFLTFLDFLYLISFFFFFSSDEEEELDEPSFFFFLSFF